MEKTVENIFKLHAEGKSYNYIREVLGYSKGTISYHLGKGQKEKTGERRIMTRAKINEFIRNQKETNPCMDCGSFYPYVVMQYDHRPEFVKLFNISRWQDHTQDIKIIIAEMHKCDLVCGNCHTLRGHLRRLDNSGMLPDEEY